MPQDNKLDLIQGSLDIMVLQALAALGPQHGYGVARRIEQVGGGQLILNQGTIYASLVRLQNRGWISAEWGESENGRRAKFYSITGSGRRNLAIESENWTRISNVINRLFALGSGKAEA